jgi:hypothetical protein
MVRRVRHPAIHLLSNPGRQEREGKKWEGKEREEGGEEMEGGGTREGR